MNKPAPRGVAEIVIRNAIRRHHQNLPGRHTSPEGDLTLADLALARQIAAALREAGLLTTSTPG